MAIIRKSQQPSLLMRWANARPGRMIILSFLLVIAVGTSLLALPPASASGRSIGLLQALFTATSATCVTGLVTVDTATHWSLFGKIVILVLIQTGGLGLVTITSFFYILMRRKATLRTLLATQESTASFNFSDVLQLVRKIVLITFSLEVAGGLLLSWRLALLLGWPRALGKGFFLSVSAFCNAGFDLMGDTSSGPFSSLLSLRDDPLILLTLAVLVILGGLGFVVWSDLLMWPRQRKLNFHSKVVLSLTGALLVLGTIFFYAAEPAASLGPANSQSVGTSLLSAFFQSTTSRTAGFAATDQAGLTDSSKLFTILLMFVGAAPGSTGGGIKITTLAIVVATIISDVQGRDNIIMMRHRLTRETFTRAYALVGLAMGIVLGVTNQLSFTERQALQTMRLSLLDLLFETTSAFATVGLSSAETQNLQPATWAILIPVMYLGRVGPASFAISLAMRHHNRTDQVYPEGRTLVG
ncbi:MAG: Trk family potassium uptake protein [Ruminococcaceae bacterium]|nr:Trk family potassium uptake protein [Oscillospiraceae bacterium]